MIFLYPELLWLLILPLLLLALLAGGKKKKLSHIFSEQIYAKLTQNRQSLPHGIRLSLFIIALCLMIIALAQPVIEKDKIKLNQKAIDVIVAVDISRSMEAKDLFPNRLEWAKKKLLKFINLTQSIRVGVMAFAQNAYVVTPVTEDKDVATYLVENLDTHNITEKGTNLLQLLDASNKQLKSALHKYIFLITDGGDNSNYDKEIAFAKEHHLTLFILGVGTEKGAPIQDKYGDFLKKDGKIILTQLNTKIKDLALQTRGSYIQTIASDEDITAMLDEIKKIAEAKTIASKEIRTFVEYFHYFLLAAVVFLLFAFHSLPRKGIALLLTVLGFNYPQPMLAAITDFQTIEKATKAYQKDDYKSAQSSFEELVKETPSDEAHYNLANSLYKQKDYKGSIKEYEALSKSFKHRQKALHNMGNAYAYSKNLEKAIQSYEEAIKINEDQETRENLEAVKKLQQKQEDKNKNKEKNSDKKNKNSKDEKKRQKDKKNGDKKDQKKEKDKDASNESKEKKKEKSEKKDQEKKKTSKKDQKSSEKAKKEEADPSQMKPSEKDLTDKAEKKLLQQLQMQKGNTFRYKIPSKFEQENHNDKPW